MVNRVLFDTTGIDISLPTFDVLTATKAQLAFDSTMISTRLIMKGTVNLTSASNTVYFGQTFSAVPYVSFYKLSGGYYLHLAAGGPASDLLSPPDPYGQIFSDRFVIQGLAGLGTVTIFYLVLER